MKTIKKCTKCGDSKKFSEFSKSKSYKDGLSYYCKKCKNKERTLSRRTKIGLITKIYWDQVNSSKPRGHIPPTYTKQELIDFALSSPKFHELYDVWVASGYQKSLVPSFDRADDYKGYSFENFNAWMPWKDNNKKGNNDIKNGINNKQSRAVIGTHKITGEVVEFYSQMEAQRQTGAHNTRISACCLKNMIKNSGGYYYIPLSSGGYIWKFKH